MSKPERKTSYWQSAPMPRTQLVLFSESLEDRIPEDHPVRLLDEVLTELDWREWEARYHGRIGQPPIHPSVMCKVLLFAILRGIGSSRKIEYELRHAIDFIWLASGRTIDHTTLSEFRRQHEEQLQDLFRQVVRLAVAMGAAKLAELCIDGTRVRADASRAKTLTAEKGVQLLAELDQKIKQGMKDLDTHDDLDDLFADGQPADQLPEPLREMAARRKKLQAAVTQLQAMDQQRKRDGVKKPAQLPRTDLDSRILPNKEGGYAPNYTPMVATETTGGFIVATDVLTGSVEHAELLPLIDTVAADYGAAPTTVMADGAYGTGANLTELEERKIELLSPVISESKSDNPAQREDLTKPVKAKDLDRLPMSPQTKRFDKHAFVYDEATDHYYCPAGKVLQRHKTTRLDRAGATIDAVIFRCHECDSCRLRARCRTNTSSRTGRTITHTGYEAIYERQSVRMQDAATKKRYDMRSHYGETPFAIIKARYNLRRFLLRGIGGVRSQWRWASLAFNVARLMKQWQSLPKPHQWPATAVT